MNRALWTLATLAVTSLTFASAAQASSTNSRIQIKTVRLGDDIVGATADGNLVAFACHTTLIGDIASMVTGKPSGHADMVLPNAQGQLNLTNYDVSLSRVTSPFVPLTPLAFSKICGSTYGSFDLAYQSGRLHIKRAVELPIESAKHIANITLRTVRYGDNLIGVTADQHIVGIACNKTPTNQVRGMVFGASSGMGDLILPNSRNELDFANYAGASMARSIPSPHFALSASAYSTLCESTDLAGQYSLSMGGDNALFVNAQSARQVESMDDILPKN